MKRLTASWTSALATAALIALPAISGAQTPQAEPTPPEPQPQQSTTLSTPTQQNTSAAEHLRLAKEALAAVDVSSVPARAKSQMTELRRHISSLERSVGAGDNASATGAAGRSSGANKARSGASWANDVAAIDRIITQLAGDASTTGATEPGAVGTSGSKSKESTAVTLDENTRNQLLEVRKHVTEFAAAMSGTSSQQPSAATSPQPTPSAAGETAAATGQTQSPTAGTGQAAPTTGQSTATAAGTTGPTPATSSPTGTAGQTPSPTGGQQTETSPSTQPNVDADSARQHLTAARNSLTQLTQLPAAAQLQGDARTQVSQLIQNFNELITTQTEWSTAYDKVEANLTALIGPAPQKSTSGTMPSTDPSAAPAPTPQPAPANPPTAPTTPTDPQAGTPGTQGTQGTQQPEAVGTSGTATLDPGIRQKLTEFREHLQKFHDAAGGAAK